jgi:hypothetical protein
MTDSTEVWPVLIVNGRVLVAPDFLVDRAASDSSITGVLLQEINPGIPPVKETILTRTFRVSKVGSLTAYFRFSAITEDLISRGSTDVFYDQPSRQRRMIEGVIACTAVDRDIDPDLIDNLRPKIRATLRAYIKDTSSWPATERSRAIRISEIVATEPEVAVPAYTEPDATVTAHTEPDLTAVDDRLVNPQTQLHPDRVHETEIRSAIWPPTYIVAILLMIGAITGVIVFVVITKLLL